MRLTLVVLCLLVVTLSLCRCVTEPQKVFLSQLGSTLNDVQGVVTHDNFGSTIMACVIRNPITINGMTIGVYEKDQIAVVKYQSAGTVSWFNVFEQRKEGNFTLSTNSITVDNLNFVYLTGAWEGIIQTSLVDSVQADRKSFYLMKISSSGKVSWVKSYTSPTGTSEGTSVTMNDAKSKVYVTGVFTGSFTVGFSTFTSKGGKDIFVVQYDPTFAIPVNALSAGGTYDDVSTGIAYDKISESIAISANSFDNISLGTKTLLDPGRHIILFGQISSSFVFKYVVRGTGTGNYSLNAMTTDTDGSTYIVVTTDSSIEFKRELATVATYTTAQRSALIAKFDENGNSLWTKQIASADDISASAIVCTSEQVYASILFSDSVTVNQGPTITSQPSYKKSSGIVALDSSSEYQWFQSFLGGRKSLTSMSTDSTYIYLAGSVKLNDGEGGSDFSSPTNMYSTDLFVAKYQVGVVPSLICLENQDIKDAICTNKTNLCTASCLCTRPGTFGLFCQYKADLKTNFKRSSIVLGSDDVLRIQLSRSVFTLWAFDIYWYLQTNGGDLIPLNDAISVGLRTRWITGTTSASISSNIFAKGVQYTLHVAFVSTGSTLIYYDKIDILRKSVTITQNEGRIGFSATANPDSNSILTMYNLTASGWKSSPASTLQYSFSYSRTKEGRYSVLKSFSEEQTAHVAIPYGLAPDYTVYLRMTVKSEYGDTKAVDLTVKNKPPRSISLNALKKAADSGNLESKLTTLSFLIKEKSQSVSRREKTQFEEIISQLLNATRESVIATDRDRYLETVTHKLSALQLITQSKVGLDTNRVVSVLNVVQEMFTKCASLQNTTESLYASLLDTQSYQAIGDVISNLLELGERNEETSKHAVSVATAFANDLLNSLVFSETSSIYSSNFSVSVRVDAASILANTTIASSGNETASIPYGFTDMFSNETIKYSMIVFSPDNNPYSWRNKSEFATPTSLIDLTFQDENGTVIPLRDLSEPIVLSFVNNVDPTKRVKEYQCRYWDEELSDWSTEGCSVVNATSQTIECACTHTTSFSAFILYSDDSHYTPTFYIIGLAANSIFILVSVPMLVAFVFMRNLQPLKSRFVAPFVGMVAVLLDCIFNGVVRNALLLTLDLNEKENIIAVNSLSYLLMLTANPLTIVAMLVYLWQHIRFIVRQNVYEMMGTNERKRGLYKVLQIISSRITYVVLTSIAAVVTLLLFVMFVIVAEYEKSNQTALKKRRENVIIAEASVYGGLVIFFGICTLAVLTVDVVLSFLRVKKSVDTKEKGVLERPTLNQDSNLAVVLTDPFHFRIDSLFIVLKTIVLLALFPIGVVTAINETEPNSNLMIGQAVLEIIYITLKIMSFGGYSLLSTIQTLFAVTVKSRKGKTEREEPLNEESQLESILQDPNLYNSFYLFAKMEMSLENVLLWNDIEVILANIRSGNAEAIDTSVLSNIKYEYVLRGSPREVNLSNKAKQQFLDLEDSNITTMHDERVQQALNSMKNQIALNMSDTYARYLSSPLYKKLLEVNTLVAHLSDGRFDSDL